MTKHSRKANKGVQKVDSGKTPSKLHGGQPGHKGKTCKPTPTEFKTHLPTSCPGCGNTALKEESVKVVYITEIPKPIKATATRHRLVTCRCDDCGMDKIESVVYMPKQGSYGKNVITTVVSNFLDRLPGRLNAANMGRYSIYISAGSIHNIPYRMGSSLGKPALATPTGNENTEAEVDAYNEIWVAIRCWLGDNTNHA